MLVVIPTSFRLRPGSNDRHRPLLGNDWEEFIRIIALISNQGLGAIPCYQRLSLGDIMPLTPTEPETQEITQSVDTHGRFGAESPSAAPQSL